MAEVGYPIFGFQQEVSTRNMLKKKVALPKSKIRQD
jgi:hypothetical protein